MSCTNPFYAWKSKNPDDPSKFTIHCIPKRVDKYDFVSLKEIYGDDLLVLPCGHCDSCIESRTRAWAIRCTLEASLYDFNCFVTLTYNDKCLPKGGLCKKDLQKFIKRLRAANPDTTIRYFACGEYGEHTHRAHYHLCLFNYFPDDASITAPGRYGGNYYISSKLQKLWPFGFVSIGDLSFDSAAYVARYCQKKLHHSGENKEFCLMSRCPGIGEQYFLEHWESMYHTDKIYFNFGRYNTSKPMRYFDKLFERINPDALKDLKTERINNSNTRVANELLLRSLDVVEKLYQVHEVDKKRQFDMLKRGGN